MLGLYVHVPFCLQKCFYCDFATAPYRRERVPPFLAALRREADLYAPLVSGRVTTVFLGGGTPSLLAGEDVRALLAHLRARFDIAADAEVSLEANPGTLTCDSLDACRDAGVNRLSVGAQTFDDELLRLLGREHTAADIRASCRLARAAGFDNINLDLLFGLPGQRPADWRRTLAAAVALAPEHLSTYCLTIEPKTVFAHRQRTGRLPWLPDDDAQAAMFEQTAEALKAAGYVQYEISNFARPGRECRHNLGYWDNQPYVGLGPGAWGYLHGERYGNVRGVRTYMNRLAQGALPVEERERLQGKAARSESVVLGLRRREGVDASEHETRYGVALREDFGKEIALLIEWGLLEWQAEGTRSERLRLTRKGMLFSNEVFVRLVGD